jgi:lipopolysaccharide transport system ATP-binding protein
MKPAISVAGLGKRYHLVHQNKQTYRTLRDDLSGLARRLFRGQWKQETGEDFWALRNINFEIAPGEIVGVIGRNGAGKSTLLKVLSRITPPTTGDAYMQGRIGSLLEVGTGFHPELTGRENIFLSGAILGMKRREVAAKFDEIVAFAEVERFLDTPVKRFSSGMYVRLAFAVAAHLETEILLVDEVLAVGDAKFQEKCLNLMSNLSQTGRSIFFVSHNLTAVAQLCQRGLVLQAGELIADAKIDEALAVYKDRPLNPSSSTATASQSIRQVEVVKIEETTQPSPGFLITLRFGLSLREKGLGLDLSIRQANHPVLFLSSAYYSDVSLGPETTSVVCTLGPVNLAAGIYSVDVKLCRPMQTWLEHLDHACEFEIERQLGTTLHLTLDAQRMLGFVIPAQAWSLPEG